MIAIIETEKKFKQKSRHKFPSNISQCKHVYKKPKNSYNSIKVFTFCLLLEKSEEYVFLLRQFCAIRAVGP